MEPKQKGVGDGQGSLACCSPWGRKESDTTEQLNNNMFKELKKCIWRRKWQPTPVFLPGESHGRRSLVGYSPRGHKESDTTETLHFHPSAEKTFRSCVCY